MFEKFLKRVEPKTDAALTGGGGLRQNSGSLANLSDIGGTGSRLGRKRSKSRVSNVERTQRLSAEQKCEIAQRELEEYAEEIRMAHEESEKHLDVLKVDMNLF